MGICKCEATKCKIKEKCYRYTKEDSVWQSYADFSVNKCNKDNNYEDRIKIRINKK